MDQRQPPHQHQRGCRDLIMHSEKRKRPGLTAGALAKVVSVGTETDREITRTPRHLQAARLERRFGLEPSVALTIAALAYQKAAR